jgi:hypothetical protein
LAPADTLAATVVEESALEGAVEAADVSTGVTMAVVVEAAEVSMDEAAELASEDEVMEDEAA